MDQLIGALEAIVEVAAMVLLLTTTVGGMIGAIFYLIVG